MLPANIDFINQPISSRAVSKISSVSVVYKTLQDKNRFFVHMPCPTSSCTSLSLFSTAPTRPFERKSTELAGARFFFVKSRRKSLSIFKRNLCDATGWHRCAVSFHVDRPDSRELLIKQLNDWLIGEVQLSWFIQLRFFLLVQWHMARLGCTITRGAFLVWL